jgi:CheY-like chemotaxis protein
MKSTGKNVVFIVDDDPDDRQLILDAFLETNPTIDCVFIENGNLLMKTLDATEPENFPSLILLDLNMPGMMGLHVLKEIRGNKHYAHIPTIILTTSTFSQDESSSYKLGASCFLHKPQSFKDLQEITASICRLWLKQHFTPVANEPAKERID